MTGKFENAPLVYVTANIRTSSLPGLTSEQSAEIEQFMVNEGLIHHKTSSITAFEIKLDGTLNPATEPEASRVQDDKSRHGYFSDDAQEAVIVSPEGFEWRSCRYETYSDFRDSFSRRISKFVDIVEPYGEVKVKEVMLSYVDVIAPLENRKLPDYFSSGSEMLPLAFFDNMSNLGGSGDLHQSGITQATRIVSPKQKITVIIEQIPTNDGSVTKCIPDVLVEIDNRFEQSLTIKKDWGQEYSDRKDYVLLLTQAATLPSCRLKDYRDRDLFNDAYQLSKELFESLINREVCNEDWEFTTQELAQ